MLIKRDFDQLKEILSNPESAEVPFTIFFSAAMTSLFFIMLED